jgi:hypothetical protein
MKIEEEVSMRIISTRLHGIIDLIVAGALIFSPFIFGFVTVGGAAVVIPIIFGILFAVYSVLTNDEVGVLRVISMPYHLMIDVILAASLALSPFLFGFADQGLNVWLPHVSAGLLIILVVLLSQVQPSIYNRRRHHFHTPHHPRSAL